MTSTRRSTLPTDEDTLLGLIRLCFEEYWDDVQMTLMLPNPFLTNQQEIRDEPAWAQLELWDRRRSGKGFRHG